MKPLSVRTRRSYLAVLVFVFIIAIPLIALYATGWRFDPAQGIVRTGGIYLRIAPDGVTARIDEKSPETNNLLVRNIFVQNISPGNHVFTVTKEGFHPWVKTLSILPQKVTEAHPLLVPESPTFTAIPEYLVATSTATTTVFSKVKNPTYAATLALFASPKVDKTASTTDPLLKTAGKMSLLPKGHTLTAVWHGGIESVPFYFCDAGTCSATTTLAFRSAITHADFYPGEQDFVLVALADGVYVAELDARSTPVVIPLVPRAGADFRMSSGSRVVIKEGTAISEVEL